MCHQDAETQESRVWTTSACSRTRSTAFINSRSLARIDPSGLAHASDPAQHGIDIGSGIATISRFTLEFAVGGKVVVAVQTAVKLHESYRIQSARHEIAVRPIRLLAADTASSCQHIPLEHAARFPASCDPAAWARSPEIGTILLRSSTRRPQAPHANISDSVRPRDVVHLRSIRRAFDDQEIPWF